MLGQARSEDGQATVELALCLPILAVLIALLVEAGALATDHVRLWHAAREAARVAVVEPDISQARSAAQRAGLDGIEITIEPATDARVRGRSSRRRSSGTCPLTLPTERK